MSTWKAIRYSVDIAYKNFFTESEEITLTADNPPLLSIERTSRNNPHLIQIDG